MKKLSLAAIVLFVTIVFCSCSSLSIMSGKISETHRTTESLNPKILSAYKTRLIENIYHYNNMEADKLPTYALHDFDGDGTPELLVWEIRVSSASFRNIFVYKYNVATDTAEHIGTMIDFSGHSVITQSKNGRGVVIAIQNSGKYDKITEYVWNGDILLPKALLTRTDETSQDWYDKINSSEFNSGTPLKTFDTYYTVEMEFARSHTENKN